MFARVVSTKLSNMINVANAAKFLTCTAQKIKFSIKDLVTFTEEILNGKLHFLCSDVFGHLLIFA